MQKTIMAFRLPIPNEILAHFCVRHHVRRLSFFGSVLKGADRPDSDVDLLVQFETEHIPGLIAMAGMENELTALLGRKVDLRTAENLSQYFRDEVVQTAEPQYASA